MSLEMDIRRRMMQESDLGGIERKADVKMVKVKLPDGRVVMRKQRPEIKVEETNLTEELYFKVDVQGLPTMYMTGSSEAGIKQELRKIVRKPDMIGSIDRVTKSEVRKAFRLKSMGKDEEEQMEENVEHSENNK